MHRSLRRSGRRVAGAAVERYRTAVAEQSRWLPVYLAGTDVAGAALRPRSGVPNPWPVLDPPRPTVAAAALSESGELSFVLAGAFGWRHTVRSAALSRGDSLESLPTLVHATAGVIRVNVSLPAAVPTSEGAALVLLDADGAVLQLPTPALAGDADG